MIIIMIYEITNVHPPTAKKYVVNTEYYDSNLPSSSNKIEF